MRIIAHMVVGPGEAYRYLPQVLERVTWWADDLHVGFDPAAEEEEFRVVSDVTFHRNFMSVSWKEDEGKFRQAAWDDMVAEMKPTNEDYIFCIDADEVVVQHEMVREAVKEFAGQRLAFRFHEMWGPNHYRIDGFWKPYKAGVLFPFRPGGRIRQRALACGREPTYVSSLPTKETPIADILHYGYARAEDRQAKYERYMELDGGKYHNPEHLRSIIQPASLAEWSGGGGIDV